MADVGKFGNNEAKEVVESIFKGSSTPDQIKKSLKFVRKNILSFKEYCGIFIRGLYVIDWNKFDLETSLKILRVTKELFGAYPYIIEDGIYALIRSLTGIARKDSQKALHESIIDILYIINDMNGDRHKKCIISSCTKNLPYPTRTYEHMENYYMFLFELMKRLPDISKEIYITIFRGIILIDTEQSKKFISAHAHVFDSGFQNIDPSVMQPLLTNSIQKFDNLMSFILKHFADIYHCNEQNTTGDILYNLLKDSFFKVVIQCRSLVATHYIFFYVCSCDKVFLNNIISEMFALFNNVNVPQYSRHMAIVHFSGICAHASFIKNKRFKSYISLLANWCHMYVQDHNMSDFTYNQIVSNTNGFSKYHLFYVACQSLLYPLVVYHSYMKKKSSKTKQEKWRAFLSALNLESIILSKFNPLLFCSTKVSKLVCQMGIELELFFITGLIARNAATYNRMSCLQESEDNEDSINILNLNNDCNFPYSSYPLPSTKNLFMKIYRSID